MIISKEELKKLRKEYPIGCKVKLIEQNLSKRLFNNIDKIDNDLIVD